MTRPTLEIFERVHSDFSAWENETLFLGLFLKFDWYDLWSSNVYILRIVLSTVLRSTVLCLFKYHSSIKVKFTFRKIWSIVINVANWIWHVYSSTYANRIWQVYSSTNDMSQCILANLFINKKNENHFKLRLAHPWIIRICVRTRVISEYLHSNCNSFHPSLSVFITYLSNIILETTARVATNKACLFHKK